MGDAGSVRVGVSAVGGEALQERGVFPQALLVFYGVLYGVLWCSRIEKYVFLSKFNRIARMKGD